MLSPAFRFARGAMLADITKLISDPRCDDDRRKHLESLRSDLMNCKTLDELQFTYIVYCDTWDALHSDEDPDDLDDD